MLLAHLYRWPDKMQPQEYHKAAPALRPGTSFRNQSSGDFEQQASLLSGWNQDYVQLSSGAFKGYVTELHVQGMHLFHEFTSQSLFQHGQLPESVIAIGVPLALQNAGIFCGAPSSTQSLHVFSGRNGFEFYSPTGLLMAGIALERQELLAYMGEAGEQQLSRVCRDSHLLRMPESQLTPLRELMTGAFDMLRSNPALIHQPVAMQSLKHHVLQQVAAVLAGETSDAHATSAASKCWNMLGESRQFVQQHYDSPISVADLCQHLDISRRSLQYSFQHYLHTNPVAYLRAERLNGVRRMLKTANSVTEAAAHWGFWHFGHFSQEYKKMFGELPSTTFKRLRSLN
ncbi:helix-turn-helix domain-containing protein [Pseudomethylobacillus aquaticus]|uniref:Helix-turn-helix domain-containing protein n=2 Tax=Pseudomethylobacillus aquaticus TaxID=2676064 RepID=A0A3N0V6I4_9PROT|nr:helix-turn-helix domain-containing protein [Pseudomethylobacillus aquaticus]